MEFGPRALGARSILGDPRSPDMQSRMNLKIKFRENFRPFAPSVLDESVSEYFEIDRPSPYMLFVVPLRTERRREQSSDEERLTGLDRLKINRSGVPAVTHVDYSARLHTVGTETNPLFHSILSKFYSDTGCPMLVNTSFNVRGEPIVCSPKDAIRCFLHTDMDCLIIGNYLVDKTEQPASSAAVRVENTPAPPVWRNFGLILMFALTALGVLFSRRASSYFTPALLAAALAGTLSVLNPHLLKPFYRAWMALTLLLGRVMTAALLSLFFYIVVTPIALALKIGGKIFLASEWPAQGETFWNRRREETPRPEDCERQF
jgi:hypothetical protein